MTEPKLSDVVSQLSEEERATKLDAPTIRPPEDLAERRFRPASLSSLAGRDRALERPTRASVEETVITPVHDIARPATRGG